MAPGEEPTFTWFKSGQEFDPEDRFKVLFKEEEDTLALVFQHINPEDAGLYTCVASTSTGKISCSAELSVEGGVTQLLKVPFINYYKASLASWLPNQSKLMTPLTRKLLQFLFSNTLQRVNLRVVFCALQMHFRNLSLPRFWPHWETPIHLLVGQQCWNWKCEATQGPTSSGAKMANPSLLANATSSFILMLNQ